MYNPPLFAETDEAEIRRIVDAFPLASAVCMVDGEFIINHLPVIWEGDALIGHVAKANIVHELVENGSPVVFIFKAEDAYISPNWYPTKPETHRHVPTWNYQVVHMHGKWVFDHSEKAKRAMVGKLTKLHERKLFGDNAWKMSDAPKDYMDNMINNIVAFSMTITMIEAKSKLSQNRDRQDFDNVITEMDAQGKPGLAARMRTLSDG